MRWVGLRAEPGGGPRGGKCLSLEGFFSSQRMLMVLNLERLASSGNGRGLARCTTLAQRTALARLLAQLTSEKSEG